MTYALSVLIPARNEFIYDIDLLAETVSNVLANSSDATEIIVTLDGYLPANLVQHKRVTYIHHSKSIGQRAATNEAARVASGDVLMKLDAHCAISPKFDEALLAHFPDNWCVVPSQMNLLVFTWKCKRCSWVKDQSPKPDKCGGCGSQYLKQVKHWFPRDGREGSDVSRRSGKRGSLLRGWRFDTKLEYQQWGALFDRQKGEPYPATMSLLGACWAMHRKLYFDIEPCDVSWGSWGQMGSELSGKVWLSGNELRVNPNCWFAHFFRVGGLGFPYEGGGRKERAMAKCRETWLKNTWPKQVYPLAWLIEKFRPIPDWHTDNNPTLALVNEAAITFSRMKPLTGFATPAPSGMVTRREQVTANTMGSSGLVSTGTNSSEHVLFVGDKSKVDGVTASLGIAGMVNDESVDLIGSRGNRTNGPSVHDPVQQNLGTTVTDSSVSLRPDVADPDPALGIRQNSDSGKDGSNLLSGQVVNGEVFLGSHDSASTAGLRSEPELRDERDSGSPIIPRKCALYYSCLSHDETLELAARANLKHATNGHELGAVSLNQRIDFGDWNVVVQREKSGTTMHYQILEGLQRSRADYVFLCESDVLYHPTHFDFVPLRDDTFYYNTNVWRVRWSDGHAVRTDGLQQVSGICAGRKLLLEHYRRRVEFIEQNGGRFDTKRMAYEPGTRGDLWGCKVANWQSKYPNIDITGHGQTLTTPHFSVDSFRNPKYAAGWRETDDVIEGWPRLSNGGLQRLLTELASGG